MAFFRCDETGNIGSMPIDKYGVEELDYTNVLVEEYTYVKVYHEPTFVIVYSFDSVSTGTASKNDATPRLTTWQKDVSGGKYCGMGKYLPSGNNGSNSASGLATGSYSPYSFRYNFQLGDSFSQVTSEEVPYWRTRLYMPTWVGANVRINFHVISVYVK